MKKLTRIALLIVALIMCTTLVLTACEDPEVPIDTTFTVTFDSNGRTDAQGMPAQLTGIQENALIAQPTSPTSATAEFDAWYKETSCTNKWNFAFDKVTANTTLYAGWKVISHDPQGLARLPFSDSLTFQQSGVTSSDVFTVKINNEVVAGTATIAGDSITWVPNSDIIAGSHNVELSVSRGSDTIGSATAQIVFTDYTGEGTEASPYVIDSSVLLGELTSYIGTVGTGKYYIVSDNLTVNSSKAGNMFDGTLLGDGKTLTIDGGVDTNKSGIFDILSTNAVVKDLTVASSVSVINDFVGGALASVNNGIIDNCVNDARISRQNDITVSGSTLTYDTVYGRANDLSTIADGGLGGLVRTNNASGIIRNSENSANVATDIGLGGIAAINYGIVTDCTNTSVIGSNASITTTPNALRYYSYAGGIVGINYGTVANARNASQMRANYLVEKIGGASGTPLDSSLTITAIENNTNIGSVVGYNADSGTVSQSVAGSGYVNGYSNVGMIAGNNAGTIEYCYSETNRATTLRGTTNVGGIAGRNTGSINGCYAIVDNVVITGLVTSPNVYAISNGTVTNSVYVATAMSGSNSVTLTAPEGTTNLLGTKSSDAAYSNVIFFSDYNSAAATLNNGLDSNSLMYTKAGQLVRQVDTVSVNFQAVYIPDITDTATLPASFSGYVNEILPMPEDATCGNANYQFKGWFTDSACTIEYVEGRLTDSITLYAKFAPVAVAGEIENIDFVDQLFGNTISYSYSGSGTVTVTIDGNVVTGSTQDMGEGIYHFTPDTIPTAGTHVVLISDGSASGTISLAFRGAGTQANPYHITSQDQLRAITDVGGTVATGQYYKLAANITLTTTVNTATVFDGYFDGDNHEITPSATTAEILFHTIGANGTVANLTYVGKSGTPAAPAAVYGAIALYNNGTITNCSVGKAGSSFGLTKNANSTLGQSLIVDKDATGFVALGAIVGVNNGTVSNCTNYLRLNTQFATGGIVGYNAADANIVGCVNYGRVGTNSHTAKGAAASYMGGIVSINFGNVSNCSLAVEPNGAANGLGIVGSAGENTTHAQYNGGIVAYQGATGSINGCSVGDGTYVGGEVGKVGTLVGMYIQSTNEQGTQRLGNTTANTVGQVVVKVMDNPSSASRDAAVSEIVPVASIVPAV